MLDDYLFAPYVWIIETAQATSWETRQMQYQALKTRDDVRNAMRRGVDVPGFHVWGRRRDKPGFTRRDDTGHLIKPARTASMLGLLADARRRRCLTDFDCYLERVRAIRQGGKEKPYTHSTDRAEIMARIRAHCAFR